MKKIGLLYFLGFFLLNAQAQNKAGELSATVKYIDADEIGPFNQGAAVIRKGTATALIDASGNFIIPYNKYNLAYTNVTAGNGIFCIAMHPINKVADVPFPAYITRYINSKGDEISVVEGAGAFVLMTSDSKYVLQVRQGRNYLYITPDGKKFPVTSIDATEAPNLHEGITVTYLKGNVMQYVTLDNKILPGGPYDWAETFSSGYGLVGKKDNFGVMKYGFIDKTGATVIPLQYSRKPEAFSGNFAKVFPQDQSDFEYAVINKKGEVIYKQTRQNTSQYGGIAAFVDNSGYFERGDNILMADGRIASAYDLLTGLDKSLTDKFKSKLHIVDILKTSLNAGNKILVFYKAVEKVSGQETNTLGFVDLTTGKVTDAPFVSGNVAGFQLMFDAVSNLAYARVYTAYNAQKRAWDYMEGYINRAGVFVIVLKQTKSVW